MMEEQNPPLGVMPSEIYEIRRCQDLSRAIFERLQYSQDIRTRELVEKWIIELQHRIRQLRIGEPQSRIDCEGKY